MMAMRPDPFARDCAWLLVLSVALTCMGIVAAVAFLRLHGWSL